MCRTARCIRSPTWWPPALQARQAIVQLQDPVLAVSGNASMWMAVFADMGACLLVVANGLRLLRHGAQP